MLTAMVIALLTDSALSIPRWDHISDFIEEPFNSAFTAFMNKSEFDAEFQRETVMPIKYIQSTKKDKDIYKLIKTEIPTNVNRFNYVYCEPFFMEICSNPIYYEKLLSYQLVSEDTIRNARSRLSVEDDELP